MCGVSYPEDFFFLTEVKSWLQFSKALFLPQAFLNLKL